MANRILDEDENNAQPGQRGEILVKGPIVSPGYHKNAAATKDAFTDGWFRTGDIGEYRDEKLYIVDRKKVRSRKPYATHLIDY